MIQTMETAEQPLIHIGYHKTGTTWLQQEVFCRSRLGFCAPWDRQTHLAIEQFVLPNAFRFSPLQARKLFEPGIKNAIKNGLVPVVTHEDLCGYPVYARYYGKEVSERLAATFPGARVLIGIREQKSTMMSHYRQYLRQGGTKSISEFMGIQELRPGFSPICRLDHFEYDLLVGHYRNLFGKDNVLVLPIELLRENRSDYVHAIYEHVGIKSDQMPDWRPRNVGYSGMTLKLLRRLNRMNFGVADWSTVKSSRITFKIATAVYRLSDRLVPGSMHEKIENEMCDAIAERCRGHFEQSNRKLSKIISIDLGQLGYAI